MAEQLRVGDISIDLRTSYEAEGTSTVKINRLKIDGTPENPTITLELELAPKIIPIMPQDRVPKTNLKEIDPK